MIDGLIWDEYEPVIHEASKWVELLADVFNIEDAGDFLIGHADRVPAGCSVWWGEALARLEGKESTTDATTFYFWTTALFQFGEEHGFKVDAVWDFLWETSTTTDVIDPFKIRRNARARPAVDLFTRAHLELERLEKFAYEVINNKKGATAKLDHDNGEREVKVDPSAQDRESDERPKWDSKNRELWFHGKIVKQFNYGPAENQERVLAAFEEEQWERTIFDPLPPKPDIQIKRRLNSTIASLNNKQKNKLIRFRAIGTGESVKWEPKRSS